MTHVFKRSLGAATALSAVLALGSTSAFAQEAPPLDSPESITSQGTTSPAPRPVTPTVSLPTIVTPQTASTPTIVLPQTSGPAAISEAVAPASRAPAASTAPAQTSRNTPTRNTAAPANVGPVAQSPVTGDALPAPVLPPEPMMEVAPETAMAPVTPVGEPDTPAEPASDGNMALAGLVGLLALVALGGAGFMLMRRRKPVNETELELAEAEVMEPARPIYVAPAPLAPTHAPEAPIYHSPEPAVIRAASAPLDANGKPVSPFLYNPVYQGKRPEERPVFTMPAGPIPTGERRSALLMQMVASRPDAANPFTSPKWRMRRARTLLTRREKMLRDQATRPFDFRDFNTHTPIKPYRPTKPAVPHMA